MGRRAVVPLTGGDVELLPDPCRTCLFWEQAAPCPQPRSGDVLPGGSLGAPPIAPPIAARSGQAGGGAAGAGSAATSGDPSLPAGRDGSARRPDGRVASTSEQTAREERLTRKQAWVSAGVQDGAPPGRVVVVDERVVAFALFGPSEAFARRSPLVPRLDPDALQLATVWVHPLHRGHGLGRVLVQAAIKEAIRLDRRSVQAYADRRWRERTCVLPATWLLHEGFEVHLEHPRTPIVRIDTRRTVRWVASLEHAWEEVLGRLPQRAPVPVPDVGTRVQANGDPPGTVR